MIFRGVISYRSFFGTAESLVILGVVFFFCSYSAHARAGQVRLAWDASTSSGVAGYQISYGPSSGNYTSNLDVGNRTSYTLTGLEDGKYFIAAKAYNSGKTSWSGFSSEVSITIPISSAAPTASFSAKPNSGAAPLTVFTDSSTGDINTNGWSWEFCNSNNTCTAAAGKIVTKTFRTPDTYTANLTVTGPDGSSTANKTILVEEISPVPPGANSSATPIDGGGSNAELVGAYDFEETSGSTVVDASGQGNTGTISGATQISQGRFGKALSFDGVNDWVTINDAASLDLTTGMTLEAWVYPTVNMSQWATVILKEQPGGGLYELYANGDQSQPLTSVTVGGQYLVLSGGPWLLANQWTHLAATYDGTTQRLYVDGTQVAQRPQSGPIQVSRSPLRLGGNSVWGEYFKGRIDEVRIYNRMLNAKEIQSDMDTPIQLGQ